MKTAMTLIETMVTLVIVSMLSATALRVATGLSRARRVDQSSLGESALEMNVKSLLSADLDHARQYRKTAKGFSLRTCAGLDAKTFELRHLPATVTYEMRPVGSRTWLVRRQESADAGPLTELICADVEAVALASADRTDLPPGGRPPEDRPPRGKPATGKWTEAAEEMIVTIDFREAGHRPLVLRHRTR